MEREPSAPGTEPAVKRCIYCNTPKPLSDFVRRTGRHSGAESRRGACRDCRRLRRAERAAAIAETAAAAQQPEPLRKALTDTAVLKPIVPRKRRRRAGKALGAALAVIDTAVPQAAAPLPAAPERDEPARQRTHKRRFKRTTGTVVLMFKLDAADLPTYEPEPQAAAADEPLKADVSETSGELSPKRGKKKRKRRKKAAKAIPSAITTADDVQTERLSDELPAVSADVQPLTAPIEAGTPMSEPSSADGELPPKRKKKRKRKKRTTKAIQAAATTADDVQTEGLSDELPAVSADVQPLTAPIEAGTPMSEPPSAEGELPPKRKKKRKRRKKASKAASVETTSAETATADDTQAERASDELLTASADAQLLTTPAEAESPAPAPSGDDMPPKRKKKRRRRRSKRTANASADAPSEEGAPPAERKPKRAVRRDLPDPPPRPEGPDASVLVPNKEGVIWMRGRTDKGRRWRQETDLDTAVTLVREFAAVVVNRRTIRRIYSNKSFRSYILNRDNYTCYFCGEYGDTIDHIVPRAKGGHTTPINCVTACHECNQSKAALDLDEFFDRQPT